MVLRAKEDRAQYHLIYATRHDEGLRTFREQERAALPKQQAMRSAALARQRKERSGGQREFAWAPDALATSFVDELRQRYRARAERTIDALLTPGARLPFDALAVAAMQHPLISEHDVKRMLGELAEQGRIRFEGLRPKARVPQWGRNHVIARI